MPTEFPMNDPQAIWQNQPTERFKMKAEELRRKARRRQTFDRLKAAGGILGGLILFALFAHAFLGVRGRVVVRLGFGVLSLWSLYFAYQTYRWIWPGRPASDTTIKATLHSYRSELEKRRDYAQHIWSRSGVTFCFLGLGLVVIPGLIDALRNSTRLVSFAPLFGLLATWLAAFLLIRRRKLQKLQREIEELSAFAGDEQSFPRV